MIDCPLFFRAVFSLSFLSFALFCSTTFSSHQETDEKPQEAPLQSWPSMVCVADILDDATSKPSSTEKKQPTNMGISLTDYHQRRGGFPLVSYSNSSPTDLVNALTDLVICGKPKPEASSISLSCALSSPKIDPPTSNFPPRVRTTSEPLATLEEVEEA